MCHEDVMIPRGKRRHPHGFRVALMLEEDRKVRVETSRKITRDGTAHTESETSMPQSVKDAGYSIRRGRGTATVLANQLNNCQHSELAPPLVPLCQALQMQTLRAIASRV